jgi:stage V sporulation protein K
MPTIIPSEEAFQVHFDRGCKEYESGNMSAAAIHLTHARRQIVPILQHCQDSERRSRHEALLESLDRALDTCSRLKDNHARSGSSSAETTVTPKDEPRSEKQPSPQKPSARAQISREEALKEVKAELDGMIGLKGIREKFTEIENAVKLQMARRANGIIGKEDTACHIVLTGNPGTGKSTVAKLLGKLLYGMGYLEKGHTVAAPMQNLKGKYIGHSEANTKEAVENALGGVLFIDEAYALAGSSEVDFGKEITDVLCHMMEEHFDKLVVVIAGYEDKIPDFLNQNDGLDRRFTIRLNMPDYTPSELTAIAVKINKDANYEASGEFYTRVHTLCSILNETPDPKRGNGGFVRDKIFALSKGKMGNRVRPALDAQKNPSREVLKQLAPDDLPFEQLCGIPWSSIERDQLQWELTRENGTCITMDADHVGKYFADMTNYNVLDEGQPELTADSMQYLRALAEQVK